MITFYIQLVGLLHFESCANSEFMILEKKRTSQCFFHKLVCLVPSTLVLDSAGRQCFFSILQY